MFLGSTYDPNGEDAKFGKELLAGFEVLKTLGFEHTVEFNDCVKERLSND